MKYPEFAGLDDRPEDGLAKEGTGWSTGHEVRPRSFGECRNPVNRVLHKGTVRSVLCCTKAG